MSVFEHRSFDEHEHVAFCHDKQTGLKAIIAVHNSNLGQAMGGCRMFNYHSGDEALNDVLRLSRGMTYKSAAANIPVGGAKSVILGDPRQHKTDELMRAMGRFIDSLGGLYVGAEDSGMHEHDMKVMAQETQHVAGFSLQEGERGDPSPATAYGVFIGLKKAVEHKLKTTDLSGVRVAIQGLGNVGYRLAGLLHEAGAELLVSDVFQANADRAVQNYNATLVAPDEIFSQSVDIVAPCALGSIIDDVVLNQLQAKIIAGSANNQLAHDDLGMALKARGILYVPDYVLNAGGIIDVYYQRQGASYDDAHSHITNSIDQTLAEVFHKSDMTGRATNVIADEVARERFDPNFHSEDAVA